MLRRVELWALCGLTVALMWAAAFYIVGTGNGEYPSQEAVMAHLGHSALLLVTAPVALLGRRYAITWYWSALFNAGIYACAGLVVEIVRLAFRLRSTGPRH